MRPAAGSANLRQHPKGPHRREIPRPAKERPIQREQGPPAGAHRVRSGVMQQERVVQRDGLWQNVGSVPPSMGLNETARRSRTIGGSTGSRRPAQDACFLAHCGRQISCPAGSRSPMQGRRLSPTRPPLERQGPHLPATNVVGLSNPRRNRLRDPVLSHVPRKHPNVAGGSRRPAGPRDAPGL
jgi:hypothetical protein